jgi:hypothetical protein
MTDRIRIPAERPRAAWAVGLALFAAVALPGCDNPACVFGGTCNPDGTPGGANPPTAPANHAWLRDSAPTLSTSFPTGVGASLQTSIGLVFSESMAASGFTQAFELITVASPVPVPVVVSALVADGRMWVGASAVPLTASTQYSLRVVENRTLTDLQGVPLVLPADRILATFTTAATNPTACRGELPGGWRCQRERDGRDRRAVRPPAQSAERHDGFVRGHRGRDHAHEQPRAAGAVALRRSE